MADTEGESRPHREPKPTEKGLQWQVELKSKEFDSCIKSWNRTANKLRVLLGDESEASTVQETRDALQSTIDKLINTQESPEETVLSVNYFVSWMLLYSRHTVHQEVVNSAFLGDS